MFLTLISLSILQVISVMGRPEEQPPSELQELINSLHETCTKKMGVSDEEVKNYNINDNSKKMMCYMKCLMAESKWAKEDESIDYEYIVENGHPKIKDTWLPAIEKCRNVPGGEECEKSYNFNVCLQKADPVHYMLP